MKDAAFLATVRELSERLVALQAPIRVLDAIKWERAIHDEFFHAKARSLPKVTPEYYAGRALKFDSAALRAAFLQLERDITRLIGQLNPLGQLMRRLCQEYQLVLRMLDARGTPEFHDLAVELYGSVHDVFHAGEPCLSELARMLQQPLEQLKVSDAVIEERRDIPAEQGVERLQAQLGRSMPELPVSVMLSDGIVSDASAGSDFIKLNRDVNFSQRDLDVLEVHEGWIHVGTTQNGKAQPWLTFLSKGTPSTSVTQEGLAVLTEIITLRSTPRRLTRLVNRIQAVAMATDGADFLEVYRHFRDRELDTEESWTLAMRTFRGSLPTLKPFTKDLSYIKGFVLIYNFLRVAVQLGKVDRIPLLLVGKIQLEDMRLFAELLEQGILAPPMHVPPHFRDLRGLATWLSFGRFIGSLSFDLLERDYRGLFA